MDFRELIFNIPEKMFCMDQKSHFRSDLVEINIYAFQRGYESALLFKILPHNIKCISYAILQITLNIVTSVKSSP